MDVEALFSVVAEVVADEELDDVEKFERVEPVLAKYLDSEFPDFEIPASAAFLLVFLLQWREKRGEWAHTTALTGNVH